MPVLSLLFGNVWRALSPWRAIADGFVWVWEHVLGREARPLAVVPRAARPLPGLRHVLRVRRARALLLEPGQSAGARVRDLALLLRGAVRDARVRARHLDGARARGSRSSSPTSAGWRRSSPARAGSGCACRSPGSRAPSTCRARCCSWRPRSARSGSTASAARSPGRTSSPGSRRRTSSTSPGTGELLVTGLNLLGLLAAITLVLVAFLGACAIARATVKAPRSLAPDFVLSLVPIALVYAIAHYFSLFVIQGQYMIPLLSDPFGKGWDLFGTAGFHPNIAILGPNTIWYVQVAALVLGPRRRPRRRPRPGGHDLPRPPGRAAQPVRDARADGALHGRRPLDPLAQVNRARARRHAGPDRRDLDRPPRRGRCWPGSGSGSGAGGPGVSVRSEASMRD